MGSIVRGTGGRNAARVHHDGPPGCGWAGGFYTPPVPSVEGTCFVGATSEHRGWTEPGPLSFPVSVEPQDVLLSSLCLPGHARRPGQREDRSSALLSSKTTKLNQSRNTRVHPLGICCQQGVWISLRYCLVVWPGRRLFSWWKNVCHISFCLERYRQGVLIFLFYRKFLRE